VGLLDCLCPSLHPIKSSGYCTCSNHTKYELVLSKDKRLVVYTRQWDEVKDKGNPVNPLLYKSRQINYLRVTALFNFLEDTFTCELFYAETSLYFK
jgi:hypothetical protein